MLLTQSGEVFEISHVYIAFLAHLFAQNLSDIRKQVSDRKLNMSDSRRQISNIIYQMLRVICHMSIVRCSISKDNL